MIFEREMRPQTAGAPTPNSAYSNKRSSMTFNAANDAAGDFGSFDSEPERGYAPTRKPSKSSFNSFNYFKKNKKNTIIIASAVAAVLLIAACVMIAAFSGIFSSGDITFQNNAYMSYVNQDKHYVIANGELVDQDFQGEVELITSADNSFAYVLDQTGEGIYMYILEGTKLTSVGSTPAEECIATASLKPGILFTEIGNSGTKYMFYSPSQGVQEISKEKKNPQDFLISADARTIVYTIEGDDAVRVPYIYENGVYDKLTTKSCIPVAVSSYGDYVYVKRNVDGVNKLFAIDLSRDGEVSSVSGSDNFISVLETNVKGDEVIFCTANSPDSIEDILDGDVIEVKSYLYRHKEKTDNVILLGTNYVTTANDAYPEIAIHKTFADKYLETDAFGENANQYTYRLTSKYEIENIYNGKGKFTPNGNYFYFLNADSDLYKLDLKDKARNITPVYEDVKDFAITEKSNVYLIDSDDYLVFYKSSTNSKPRISSYANEMSIYSCANKLYFAENESEVIYLTEEGSEKDIAKFGTSELKSVPYFSSQTTKKGYAVVYNESAGSFAIYYTSNGNRFKLIKAVTNCTEITYGVIPPEGTEW